MEKPLFIPLKREYYEAFRNRTKKTEYRAYGPRWNERTASVGRRVVLSLGYGRAHRLTGEIVLAFKEENEACIPKAFREIYGPDKQPWCMEMKIEYQMNERELNLAGIRS